MALVMIGAPVNAVCTAIVHAPDGIRFMAAAPDRAGVASQLIAYIRDRCDDTLWPDDARHVRALIAAEREDEAINAYFAKVGQRWDEERLERLW